MRPDRSALTFWPVTPLPRNVAEQLLALDVDVRRLRLDDRSVHLSETRNGTLVMQILLEQGSSDPFQLERLFDALERADINYIEWRLLGRERFALTRTFQAGATAAEHFYAAPTGERLLSSADLRGVEHIETAAELLRALRDQLRVLTPPDATPVSAREVTILLDGEAGQSLDGPRPAREGR